MISGGASDWGEGGLRQYRICGSRGMGGTAPQKLWQFRFHGAPNFTTVEYFSQIMHSNLTIIMEKRPIFAQNFIDWTFY